MMKLWTAIMFGVPYRFYYLKGSSRFRGGGGAVPPGKRFWFEIDRLSFQKWKNELGGNNDEAICEA